MSLSEHAGCAAPEDLRDGEARARDLDTSSADRATRRVAVLTQGKRNLRSAQSSLGSAAGTASAWKADSTPRAFAPRLSTCLLTRLPRSVCLRWQ